MHAAPTQSDSLSALRLERKGDLFPTSFRGVSVGVLPSAASDGAGVCDRSSRLNQQSARAAKMPQLSGGGGGGGDPELCATDEMIPFKDEGDPHKEQIFAELSHSEEEGDLADIKSSLVNESESSPNSNSHDVSNATSVCVCDVCV